MGNSNKLQIALSKHRAGKQNDAIILYKKILNKEPSNLDANYLLGTAYLQLGMLDDAMQYLCKAEHIMPDSPFVKVNLGNVYKSKGLLKEAMAYFTRAIEINNSIPEAYCCLGGIYNDMGRYEDAESCFWKAVELNPNHAVTWCNMGITYYKKDRFGEAEKMFRHSFEIEPGFQEAYLRCGLALLQMSRYVEAEQYISHSIALGGSDSIKAVSALFCAMQYNNNLTPEQILKKATDFGAMVTHKVNVRYKKWVCPSSPEVLKVGIVSGDFRNHPVGYFLEKTLEYINRNRLKLFAYSTNARQDEQTERLKPLFSSWKSLVGINDDSAAKMIYEDGIHVLLDLSGHSANNRLPVFAYKPAPVQATWVGFLATTGVREMDYLIGDPYSTPPEIEWQFTEKIWRMPDVWACFSPPHHNIEPSELPAIANGYVTFGSLNNLVKMNDNVVHLWSRILHSVKNSRLFLKSNQLNDPAVCETTIKHFETCGIPSDRLIIEGSSPRGELLASYNRVDIALDPYPYGGGTTTYEALWMAVPVVTIKGDRFLSRCGCSLVSNVGLSDWVALNEDDYVAIAVKYASDLQKLSGLRSGLRQKTLDSPLYDAQRFAQNLEQALWGMWNNFANK